MNQKYILYVMWWEGGSRERGIYVYLWLIHILVWQKLAQHCKSIILQLKKIFLSIYSMLHFVKKKVGK